MLAYMPKPELRYYDDYGDTVFPEEVADSLPRLAIAKRNEWMLKRSDIVVTYVKRVFGGAFKYKQKAIKKGKFVIQINKNRIYYA